MGRKKKNEKTVAVLGKQISFKYTFEDETGQDKCQAKTELYDREDMQLLEEKYGLEVKNKVQVQPYYKHKKKLYDWNNIKFYTPEILEKQYHNKKTKKFIPSELQTQYDSKTPITMVSTKELQDKCDKEWLQWLQKSQTQDSNKKKLDTSEVRKSQEHIGAPHDSDAMHKDAMHKKDQVVQGEVQTSNYKPKQDNTHDDNQQSLQINECPVKFEDKHTLKFILN